MTILTAPGNNSSVNNEMLFIIQDAKALDPVTYPNYKYVLDIYVDGELKARLRSTPDPVNSLGKFDVSVILRDYVPVYGLKADAINSTETYDIKLDYTCKLGEEYSETLYLNLVTHSERNCVRTYAPRPFLTSDIINERMNSFATNSPFSNKPHTAYKTDYWLLIPYIGNVSGAIISCEFSSNGTIVGAGTADFIYTATSKVFQINAGFEVLSNMLGLTAAQKESITRLDITDNSGTSMRFDYACSRYPPINLAWLNPYGAYESQSFGLVSKKSNQINRKEFAQLPYQVNASGVVSYDSNGVMYGSKKGYGSVVKVSLGLTSHLLTDGEYTWLADLFNSPDVYFFSTVLDRWVPCSISDSNYEYRTFLNSRLKPLQFNINFTDEYNAQYL